MDTGSELNSVNRRGCRARIYRAIDPAETIRRDESAPYGGRVGHEVGICRCVDDHGIVPAIRNAIINPCRVWRDLVCVLFFGSQQFWFEPVSKIWIGIDTGGTFTDLVLCD